MSEPGITPLAQRLAEENNVDWRALEGSGSDGRIVERDVLSYLARVMAGEEALDPTPEPVPDGMEAWPDAGGFGGDRIEEVSDAEDFGTAVVFDAAAAEAEAAGAADDGLELSEDIFLFGGEEDEGASGFGESAADLPDLLDPAGEAASGRADAFADAIDDFSSDFDDDFDDESLLIAGDDDFFGLGQASVEEGADARDAAGQGGFGLSVEPEEGLLGRTDDLLDDAQFEDADLTDLAMEDGELDDPLLAEENLRAFEGTLGEPEESLEQQAGTAGSDGYPSHEGTPPPEEDFDIDFSQLTGWDEGESEPADDAVNGDDLLGGEDLLAGEDLLLDESDDAAATDAGVDFELEESGAASGYEAAFAAALREAAEEGEDPGEAPADEAGTAEAGTVLPDEPAGLPLADFGTLLRRRLDVTQLSQAQQAVGRELGLQEARAALPFLHRAATRALRQVELVPASGRVAAAVITEGSLRLVTGDDTGFRELAGQLAAAAGNDDAISGGDAAVLAVADMSSFEVDEAVLDLGVPVLTLGRVVHDAETGGFRSTLTLSGHYDLEDGARFLQAASELLTNPLTLLI